MIESVRIKNFQSLHDVSVDLKPFTVIVGPSSSGKSAFTRALKTLTSNQRGDSFITHGESQCVIMADTDKGTVALLRGKKNEYTVITDEGGRKDWTKLNGTTPEEVSDFIGIPARDPLNYSNQFDMPYLLTASAAEVARTLGDLTNVSVIFEASREANRRRLVASATLKNRAADYQDATKNLDRYKTLQADTAKVEEAEALYYSLVEAHEQADKLEKILANVRAIPEVPEKKELPDLSSLEELSFTGIDLETLIRRYNEANSLYEEAVGQAVSASLEKANAEKAYAKALEEMGTCPVCGQDTHGIHL